MPLSNFVMALRSDEAKFLDTHPVENHLLNVIARRARRTKCRLTGLDIGECFIGHKGLGLTEQQYRTAKKNLKKWGLVEFKKGKRVTDAGTVAKLLNTSVYDINESEGNGRVTEGQRKGNGRVTTNNNDNNVNNENKSNLSDSSESEPPKKADKIPYQKVASLYKSILVDTGEPGMSLIDMKVLTTKRKAAIKKYWTREGKHGLERVEGYFNWIWNNRGDHSWIFGTQGKWKADLEYLLREETIAKAREQRLGNFGSNQQ